MPLNCHLKGQCYVRKFWRVAMIGGGLTSGTPSDTGNKETEVPKTFSLHKASPAQLLCWELLQLYSSEQDLIAHCVAGNHCEGATVPNQLYGPFILRISRHQEVTPS